MSEISLTLVLQIKTSKIINDVAKVQIKSEKITPIGGIFHVRELFSRFVAPIIDKVLGIRCKAAVGTGTWGEIRSQPSHGDRYRNHSSRHTQVPDPVTIVE
jgi:hypothetical protein